jgi:hypothetical protein
LADFDDSLLTKKVFLEGPAGSGKTTYATRHLLRLLEKGAQPDHVLILVPQVTLSRPYQLALHNSEVAGGAVNILTVAGLARQAIETFWPIVAAPMGFADPAQEPIFLNIETAQYFMARLAAPSIEEGKFESVSIAPPRIISQVLDNLNRASIMRFPLDEVAERLIAAWGRERESTRPPVFRAAADLARQFRELCLQNNLLDFSLIAEAFNKVLLPDARFEAYLRGQVDFLIADNIEEDNPAAHDFVRWLLPHLHGALLIYDSDGGYRSFLGADADNAYGLSAACDESLPMQESLIVSPDLSALGYAFNRSIGPTFEPSQEKPEANARAAFTYAFHRYYPQMIDWTAEQVVGLIVDQGVAPREIAILAPYLNDSLRFSLTYALQKKAAARGLDLASLSHRPSRALRDEPVTRALLTLAALAHPGWIEPPPVEDVSDALSLAVESLDPVRARLLTDIVYRKRSDAPALSTFARINPDMQKRISYRVGERFEALRDWLESYKAQVEHEGSVPLDHFLRRLFGEVLSQPGFGFHTNLEAGRVAAQLIASAQQFRRALYPGNSQDWNAAGREYISLINQRLLPALYPQSWQDEDSDAVFLAPASTFLLRNRFVDYQFWLDVGSNSWSERLEQPLTHPYVLRRDYLADMLWTDDMEAEAQSNALYRIVIGLVRRCRKQIYLGIADLGESGFEQRGILLRVLQLVLRGTISGENPAPTHEESV